MRSRFSFADRAGKLRDEVRGAWTGRLRRSARRSDAQVDALVKRAAPAASVAVGAEERAQLDKLAMASQPAFGGAARAVHRRARGCAGVCVRRQ